MVRQENTFDHIIATQHHDTSKSDHVGISDINFCLGKLSRKSEEHQGFSPLTDFLCTPRFASPPRKTTTRGLDEQESKPDIVRFSRKSGPKSQFLESSTNQSSQNSESSTYFKLAQVLHGGAHTFTLTHFPEDALAECLSYLSTKDLRSVSATCRQIYSLTARTASGRRLWTNLAIARWSEIVLPKTSSMSITDNISTNPRTHYIDFSTSCTVSNGDNGNDINFSILLGMAPKHQPTKIDDSHFRQLPGRNRPEFISQDDVLVSQSNHVDHQAKKGTPKRKAVSASVLCFMGPPQSGNRSVQANQPFPQPLPPIQSKFKLTPFGVQPKKEEPPRRRHYHRSRRYLDNDMVYEDDGDSDECISLLGYNSGDENQVLTDSPRSSQNVFCRKMGECITGHPNNSSMDIFLPALRNTKPQSRSPRPFVSPFATGRTSSHGAGFIEFDIGPRLLAYYEVTIQSSEEINTNSTAALRRPRLWSEDSPRCVAIGLSTKQFCNVSRMPGWDDESWGYHSDDGCTFHGDGISDRRFGPTFGPGDTIGCGVDYVSGGIFFTLNGSFLGYGWTHVPGLVLGGGSGMSRYFRKWRSHGNSRFLELYPTIGVDTDWMIAPNFGSRPFVFDFATFAEEKTELAVRSLSD